MQRVELSTPQNQNARRCYKGERRLGYEKHLSKINHHISHQQTWSNIVHPLPPCNVKFRSNSSRHFLNWLSEIRDINLLFRWNSSIYFLNWISEIRDIKFWIHIKFVCLLLKPVKITNTHKWKISYWIYKTLHIQEFHWNLVFNYIRI